MDVLAACLRRYTRLLADPHCGKLTLTALGYIYRKMAQESRIRSWVPSPGTRCKYFPVSSEKTSLFFKVPGEGTQPLLLYCAGILRIKSSI